MDSPRKTRTGTGIDPMYFVHALAGASDPLPRIGSRTKAAKDYFVSMVGLERVRVLIVVAALCYRGRGPRTAISASLSSPSAAYQTATGGDSTGSANIAELVCALS